MSETDTTKVCDDCGTVNQPMQFFCRKCGFNLAWKKHRSFKQKSQDKDLNAEYAGKWQWFFMTTSKYFSSFRGYSKPVVPVGEIPFAETESSPSFYKGWFDGGNLIRFEKLALTRRETRQFELSSPMVPDTKVYFQVKDRLAEPIAWAPIPYHETEGIIEFYEGFVNGTGRSGEAVRFQKQVAFSEESA